LNGWNEEEVLGQSYIAKAALPKPPPVAMGQSSVSYTLHQKILANGKQGVFSLFFLSLGHTAEYPKYAKPATDGFISSQMACKPLMIISNFRDSGHLKPLFHLFIQGRHPLSD